MATQFIGTPTEQEIADAARIEEIEKKLDSGEMSMADLKQLAFGEMEEFHRQVELRKKVADFQAAQLDRKFDTDVEHEEETFEHGKESPEARQIREDLARKIQKDELDNSPEAKAERQKGEQYLERIKEAAKAESLERIKEAAEAERRANDAIYVAEQTQKSARQLVAEEIRIQQSLALQREWVSRHPDYVTSQENGDAIKNWVIASGAQEFTFSNLEAAYSALRAEGKLALDPSKQRQAEAEVVRTVPARRSSSVSTNAASRSMYDRKMEPTAEDLENMPMDKFLELGRQNGLIDPEAEMHEGIAPRRAYPGHTPGSFLPQF